MCDFSLQHAKSRPAQVADKLTTHNFGRGTVGFRDATTEIGDATAVCVMPGTEVAFDKPIVVRWSYDESNPPIEGEQTLARFRQINKDSLHQHHDALELANGQTILLTRLEEGQGATVLQLPAEPKNEAEAEEQKRLEVVG